MINVGLVGCGNIGSFIADYLDKSAKFNLVSVFDADEKRARELTSKLKHRPIISKDFNTLLQDTDLIIEAASQEAVHRYGVEVLRAGKDLLVMSAGAFSDRKLFNEVKKEAEEKECFVYLPSGAICGVDGVKSASVGKVSEVTLTTTKPPAGLEGVEYLKTKGVNLKEITKSTLLYEGSAREAVRLFPKNVNVSTVLGLAGIGLDKTKVRVVADPKAGGNIHEIHLKGECGEISVRLDNKASPNNPKTSYLACLSAVRTLEGVGERVKIGT